MQIDLFRRCQKVMTHGKGIFSFDESPFEIDETIKRFSLVPSAEARRQYRDIFISTRDLDKYINGIVLHEDGFWQEDLRGNFFKDALRKRGIFIIVKVDGGCVDFPGFPGEKISRGLDGLRERLLRFKDAGAELAQWTAEIVVGDNLPTEECIEANSIILAEYAMLCQQEQIIPVIETKVISSSIHTIEDVENVTSRTLDQVFETLRKYRVDLTSVLLKTNMVVPGNNGDPVIPAAKVAQHTIGMLIKSVPKEVPGIVFMSGMQPPKVATQNLNEISRLEPLPWHLSFAFLHALIDPVIKMWAGREDHVEFARKEFVKRLEYAVMAEKGEYDPTLEGAVNSVV